MESESSDLESLDLIDLDFECKPARTTSKRKKAAPSNHQPPKRHMRCGASKVVTSTPIVQPFAQSQRRVAENAGANQQISAKNIYDAVCSGKSAIVKTVLNNWLDSYKQNKEEMLLVLFNAIVQCCGCKGVIREMFDNTDMSEVAATLTREFNEDSEHYPLTAPGPQKRRFKLSLCEFMQVLVQSCQHSFLLDGYLFPLLMSLLTHLSDSTIRAFRHTSTLLAMKMTTELTQVFSSVSLTLMMKEMQYKSEKKKNMSDQSIHNLDNLKSIIIELKEEKDKLESMMSDIFCGVFVNRYRDLVTEIRSICIEELGQWLVIGKDIFLNDGSLKYLGWMLNDKESSVRLRCVQVLQGLYKEEEFIGHLEVFTTRFKNRLIHMSLDTNPVVGMEVVKLLLLIKQRMQNTLSMEDCHHIYSLAFASHRGLSAAAGDFLYNKIKSVISVKGRTWDEESRKASFFQVLISFFKNTQFHDHPEYLVDSLWGTASSELKDWGTMTTLLLQDASDNQGLTNAEEAALTLLMISAMRQAAEATPPAGRTSGKKMLSKAAKEMQKQDRRRITTHFIPLLPQLLAKYSADARIVARLLRAPSYFDLEMYSSSAVYEKHLKQLLVQICSIMEKHTNDAVLEACNKVIYTLSFNEHNFYSTVHQTISQLMDGLTERFSFCLTELQEGTADEDDRYNAAITLKRIAAVSSAEDLSSWELFDSCLGLLTSGIDNPECDPKLMVQALKCVAIHLLWVKSDAAKYSPKTVEEEQDLKRRMESCWRAIVPCLYVGQMEIYDCAFKVLCDLLIMLKGSPGDSNPALDSSTYDLDDYVRVELAGFILENVFPDTEDLENAEEDEEELMKRVQRKRIYLASYSKLIIYGVLDFNAATNIFRHYDAKYVEDFGDIMKEMLRRMKIINPIRSAKVLCLCLKQLFSQMLAEVHSKQDLLNICGLAKRFCSSFGINRQQASKPLIALHMDGIQFAFRTSNEEEQEEQYPNLDFLEILTEFSFKLLPQKCPGLLKFFKSQLPRGFQDHPAVTLYRRSLSQTNSRVQGRNGIEEVVEEDEEVVEEDEEVVENDVSFQGTSLFKRKRTTAEDSASSTMSGGNLQNVSLTSRTQYNHKNLKPTEVPSNSLSDVESMDEFSSGPRVQKGKRRPQLQSLSSSKHSGASAERSPLTTQLDLLSLMDEGNSVRDESEAEDYDDEIESGYTLPSTRNTSVSFIDELFD